MILGTTQALPLAAQVLAYTSQRSKPAVASEPATQMKLVDALIHLKKHYKADILFEESMMSDVVVTNFNLDKNRSAEYNIEQLLKHTNLVLRKVRDNAYMILPRRPQIAPISAPQPTGTINGQAEIRAKVADMLIKGTVTDATGEGLPGVNVLVKGTAIGTNTDVNGKYEINVPAAESVLIFSSIGFQKQEIIVGQRNIVDVKLATETANPGRGGRDGPGYQTGEKSAGVLDLRSERRRADPGTLDQHCQ